MLLIGVLPLGVYVINWGVTSVTSMLLTGVLPLDVQVINLGATSGRPCY